MPPRLASNPVVWTLAADLGLRPGDNPLEAIVRFSRQRIRGFLKEIPCTTLTDLLSLAAAKVDTLFVEINTDEDVQEVKERYLAKGELAFADLEHQLGSDVYAITFKRQTPGQFDRKFISVIDCRGEKGARRYFSKWHEIAHLLTLTSQQRLKFCRSHVPEEIKDPEEAVMDVIAGNLGFFDELVRPYVKSQPTFDAMAKLRSSLCPDASAQASVIGFIHAWKHPCLFIEAELALKKSEKELERQESFGFHKAPTPVLRAVRITPNDAARQANFFIPRNMRVPDRSVISQVFEDDVTQSQANEDLSWWVASEGGQLAETPVLVVARRAVHRVQALISTRI